LIRNNMIVVPTHPICLCFPTILTQLRWSRQNLRRCWTHKTQLPGLILKWQNRLERCFEGYGG
jgi:hypothetical protein